MDERRYSVARGRRPADDAKRADEGWSEGLDLGGRRPFGRSAARSSARIRTIATRATSRGDPVGPPTNAAASGASVDELLAELLATRASPAAYGWRG